MVVETNSLKAWLLASRPKTLAAAIAPVCVGCGIAAYYGRFKVIPALACLFFAVAMQIAANLINDYYDYLKGADGEDRLGPLRATSQGWITPNYMKIGIIVVIALGCCCGSVLIYFAGIEMIAVGLFCVVFAYIYTSGPFPLAYNGLGDVAVILFFGLVAVGFTAYVQLLRWTPLLIWGGLATGMVVNTLLVLNNYRDREGDAKVGKKTLIVLCGETFGRYFYLALGVVAVLILHLLFHEALPEKSDFTLIHWCCLFVMPIIYLLLHYFTWRKISLIRQGRVLNTLIGETSRNMLIFSLTFAIGFAIIGY